VYSSPAIQHPEIETLQAELHNAYPQTILRRAVDMFGDDLVVVTSFQPTGIVTLHMLQEIAPHLSILTVDTNLLFDETYQLMDQLEREWGLNLIRVRPSQSVAEQAQTHGNALWLDEPNKCCELRKVIPLKDALQGYQAWISGVRRDQSASRSETAVVSWDKRNEKVKFCPFATWTESMIWTYIHTYNLPCNALHTQGYSSIGCFPCTQAVKAGDDLRAGRWVQHAKTECGIHVQSAL